MILILSSTMQIVSSMEFPDSCLDFAMPASMMLESGESKERGGDSASHDGAIADETGFIFYDDCKMHSIATTCWISIFSIV